MTAMFGDLFRRKERTDRQTLQFVNDDVAQQQHAVGRLAEALETVNALLAETPDDQRLARLRDQIAATRAQLEANTRITAARAAEFVAFMRGMM